jgi:hypothetical protein
VTEKFGVPKRFVRTFTVLVQGLRTTVRKSTINNAGNGLFAAKEFQKGETLGFYVGNVVYKYGKKWTTKASEEFLQEELGFLEADSRTMTLVDKEGFHVVVNPCYGRKREKITDAPLLMGMHFLNDFTKIYDEQTGGKKGRS